MPTEREAAPADALSAPKPVRDVRGSPAPG